MSAAISRARASNRSRRRRLTVALPDSDLRLPASRKRWSGIGVAATTLETGHVGAVFVARLPSAAVKGWLVSVVFGGPSPRGRA